MLGHFSIEGVFDEDRIMKRLPSKFRKRLLLCQKTHEVCTKNSRGLYKPREFFAIWFVTSAIAAMLTRKCHPSELVRCPLFSGMPDVVISSIAMRMQPYLALEDDVIFGENEVGDAMFVVISGEVRLSSQQCPEYQDLVS